MTTYGVMIDRIEAEIGRSDLTARVKEAILTSIKHYERRRFYFTEFIDSLSTSSSQEFYSVSDYADMSLITEVDSLRINDGTYDYPLMERDWSYMEQVQTYDGVFSDPTDYTFYSQRLRLYPIPDAGRTIHISGVKKLASLSATTDTNAWMTDGEALIRARAKAELYAHVVHKPDKSAVMHQAELNALSELEAETWRRVNGKIRATQF
jgi:hypothetical protein